jgi:serine/threonine-protein kinase RsbW
VTNESVTASSVGFSGKIVKLTIKGSERSGNFLSELLWTFESCLKQDIIYFIVDLRFLKDLPSATMVLLLEMTNRARRKGGDLFLINIGRMARNNLLTFNPSSYLASAGDEETAIDECEDRIQYQKSSYYPRQPFFHEAQPSPHIDLKQDSMEIPSRVESLYKACNFAVDFARSMRFPDSELNKIKIAVYEACLNAIEHAYHSDPTQVVRVDVEQTTDRLIITVIDHGNGFQADNQDFDIMEAAAHRRTGGMGLHIIRRSMDEVNYKMDPIMGNRLVMVKYLSSASRQEEYEFRSNIKIR